MASHNESTITVGTLRRDNPDIPTPLQGATILYTTRTDIKAENKFVMIDDNKNIIKNKDGKSVRFGFEQYQTFIDKHYLDVNDGAERIIRQDLGLWKMQQAELAAKSDYQEENVQTYDLTEQRELVKDPSAHLFGFFLTCFIITLIVCLGRIFAPMIIERVTGTMG